MIIVRVRNKSERGTLERNYFIMIVLGSYECNEIIIVFFKCYIELYVLNTVGALFIFSD